MQIEEATQIETLGKINGYLCAKNRGLYYTSIHSWNLDHVYMETLNKSTSEGKLLNTMEMPRA
jgi:hypothetical protein